MAKLNPKLIHVPKHKRDRMISASLADNFRQQYGARSARVHKGDSIRIVRGEYKGVEGKVDEILTVSGKILIEGVQREKIKGGNVRVPIHASSVVLINLNLDDKWRSDRLQGKTVVATEEKNQNKETKAKKRKEEKS